MRPRPPWSPARAHEILSGIRAPVPVLLALQSLQEEFGVPVKLVGTGEGVKDLQTFDTEAFLEGVFEEV